MFLWPNAKINKVDKMRSLTLLTFNMLSCKSKLVLPWVVPEVPHACYHYKIFLPILATGRSS